LRHGQTRGRGQQAIIIDKPAGLPVTTPRSGAISVENHLASLCFGFQRWPTIVHRLDQDTSGCLLLARNPKAHKRFSAAFEAGEVRKTYHAVLDGIPEGESGVIDLPLHKVSSRDEGWRMVVDAKKGKPSLTHWQVLTINNGRALIEFKPETGRTHQLRVHAAGGLGHAISGDPVYGGSSGPMLLHARTLAFDRAGKATVSAKAPYPPEFIAAGFCDD
jgi:tRNA pseudouridine32 synthase / 23S rRNA pseudouridine746 synthase